MPALSGLCLPCWMNESYPRANSEVIHISWSLSFISLSIFNPALLAQFEVHCWRFHRLLQFRCPLLCSTWASIVLPRSTSYSNCYAYSFLFMAPQFSTLPSRIHIWVNVFAHMCSLSFYFYQVSHVLLFFPLSTFYPSSSLLGSFSKC